MATLDQLMNQFIDIMEACQSGIVDEDETFELLTRWADLATKKLPPLLSEEEGSTAYHRLSRPFRFSSDGELTFHFRSCRAYLVGLRFAMENNPDIVNTSQRGDSVEASSDIDLLKTLEELRDLMIDVATGGSRIDKVNRRARELFGILSTELERLGIENPVPYSDLWGWYERWSQPDLATYRSRREFLAALFDPLRKTVEARISGEPRDAEPTGWGRVDRCAEQVKRRLLSAKTEEDYQGVGHLCREMLISVAENVYDSTQHPTTDGVEPSSTDTKRMLEAYIGFTLPGSSNEAARRHARSAVSLADALVHDRMATYRDAALCHEATTTVVNVIGIIAGRHTAAR